MINSFRDSVIVTILYNGEEFVLRTYTGEYRNLMMLIYDKIYIEGFGECKGMGKCATCMVNIKEGQHQLPRFERNENETLRKSGNTNPRIRLACQIQVTHLIDQCICEVG